MKKSSERERARYDDSYQMYWDCFLSHDDVDWCGFIITIEFLSGHFSLPYEQ